MLSRMESRRAYDLFPFISAPVKCGFRKALVMSMISRAVILKLSPSSSLLPALCFPAAGIHSAGRLTGGKVWRMGGMVHIDFS